MKKDTYGRIFNAYGSRYIELDGGAITLDLARERENAPNYPFADAMQFCPKHTRDSDVIDVAECNACFAPITLREAHDKLWNAMAYTASLYREPWELRKYMDVYAVIEPLRREIAAEFKDSEDSMTKPTIYEALALKLGRTPTHNEICADVKRILREVTIDLAGKGKLSHQRRSRTDFKRR